MPREVCNLPQAPPPGKLAWTLLPAQWPVTLKGVPASHPEMLGKH